MSVAVLLDKFIKTSDRLAEEERERRRELKRSKERVKCMLDPLLERLTAVGTGGEGGERGWVDEGGSLVVAAATAYGDETGSDQDRQCE